MASEAKNTKTYASLYENLKRATVQQFQSFLRSNTLKQLKNIQASFTLKL